MAFNIIMTGGGQSDYNHCMDYLLYELQNPQAAYNLLIDVEETLSWLRSDALAYALCEDVYLERLGMRKVHLRKHSYKIYYKVSGNDVFVEAILHDKQDVKKWLIKSEE